MSRRPPLLPLLEIVTTWGCPSMVVWQSSSRASPSCISSSCCSDTICAAVFPSPFHSSSNTCRRGERSVKTRCFCHLLCLCGDVEGREGLLQIQLAPRRMAWPREKPPSLPQPSQRAGSTRQQIKSPPGVSWLLSWRGQGHRSARCPPLADSSQATCPPHRELVMDRA